MIGILLLTGCGQINDDVLVGKQAPVSEKTGRYGNEKLDISVRYPSESFDEYETKFKDLIRENKISIKETRFADHPAREYGMEGAINYIIELGGRFVLISTESGLTEEQRYGLREILNSLTFQ